ncbi:MAG: 2-C-methyl-D-erythritol 4-phosphate cytidylyltransferase [Bdellovibrionales bacterium]|nr:2-C-methyl-D-erythritol 4-phosphate cytidylyltransferase [Bdellovibrionales bacterium]
MNHAVIVAGGTGSRMGLGFNKVFAELGGEPVLAHTIRAFENSASIDSITVVAGNPDAGSAEDDCAKVLEIVHAAGFTKVRKAVAGGSTRMASVENGLMSLGAAEDDIVLVQDGGRPFVTPALIEELICAVKEHGAAVCGVVPNDTIHAIDAEGFVKDTYDRSRLLAVHTPAAARWGTLKAARDKARSDGYLDAPGFEDSAVLARFGAKVKIVQSRHENIKLTTPQDMQLAAAILADCKN